MEKFQLFSGFSIFLFSLLFLPGFSTTTPEPQYLVLVPFLIHTETTEKICIQLTHLNESVTLSVVLEYTAWNRSLIKDVITEKDVFQCVPFQLPKWNSSLGSPEVFLLVTVKGPSLEFRSRKKVLIQNVDSLVFIPMDKSIYRAGQKVQFRIVSLDENFRPLNEKFPLVYIQDPQGNRLFQWTDVELSLGLTQLSFSLSSEPRQGTYRVALQKASGKMVEHTFDVEEYVLPRYEVSVKTPKIISIMATEIQATVCGKYTYGKPVPGLISVKLCRPFHSYGHSCYGKEAEALCEEFSGEADVHGCLSRTVKTKLFQLKQKGFQISIEVEGKITEEGTGVELTGRASIEVTPVLSTVTFEKMDTYYKPGIPYFVQAKLVDSFNVPIVNAIIKIQVGQILWNVENTTDEQGRVQFFIDTTNFTTESVSFEASYKEKDWCPENWLEAEHKQAYHTASYFYSPSQSYIKIVPISKILNCGYTHPVQVYYVLNPGLVKEEDVVFYYLVMAKGGIVHDGTHVQTLEHGQTKGEFTLNLSVEVDSAPVAQLLLYTILPSGELVTDSEDFMIENCFANKVTLHFSDAEGLPSSETYLHISASRNSLCAIQAVDKSVFLLKPEAELSPQTVYNLLPVKSLKGYHYADYSLGEENMQPCTAAKNILVDSILYRSQSFSYNEGDAYEILKDTGLKVFTSTKIHKPEICPENLHPPPASLAYGKNLNQEEGGCSGGHNPVRGDLLLYSLGKEYDDGDEAYHVLPDFASSEEEAAEAEKAEEIKTSQRSFLPETWKWQIVTLRSAENPEVSSSPDGLQSKLAMAVTIPDTITEWQAGAFCTSAEAGFGLAQTTYLKAFQPFFLELTLPYSVVRGEDFTLKATVFSYLQHCIRVAISLALSSDFMASPVEKEEDSYCLCANERKTVSWTVIPRSLGEVNFTASAEAIRSDQLCGNEIVETPSRGQKDILTKSLLVVPEGEEKEVTFNSLLCVAENAQTETVSLKLPGKVVEGSARASYCVLGDILGSAVKNLHQLLQMPYGCGEQNIALFAPNIYILDYLNKTEQLTEEIKSKAMGYLVAGYQRQLNYKHSDGSYSTFGEHSHLPGNTWLTAFVLRAIAQARRYIFVDPKHIADAQAALAVMQKPNGCFRSTGSLLNNALKGGVDNEVTLSAYITITLLEIPLPLTHPVMRNVLFCLEKAAEGEVHVYTRALLAYAFALAGKGDKRKEMLWELDKEAVKDGDGSMHWQRPGKKEEKVDLPYYQPRSPSAEVEMASYVLLAYLTTQPTPSQEDLTAAASIAKGLIKQQNPTGGFSSTQDTVVALQALSLYRAATYAKRGAGASVTLRSEEGDPKEFQVNSSNSLLLQCQELPKVPGDYKTEVSGEGCAYVQTTLKYNVDPHQKDAPFALEVQTVPRTDMGPQAPRTFQLVWNVSYTGHRPSSNMVIVDIKMLSGFIPMKSSIQKLERQAEVKRVEVSGDHVLLYLEELSNTSQQFSLTMEQNFLIRHLKPALIKVYDYYETDEFAVAAYSAPFPTEETELGNA
ncbi:alpha-2-macroglobulin-like [Liasis olivaceus]